MNDLASRMSEQLCGQRCLDFRFVEGGTLILYFAPYSGEGTSQKRLWIDCAWRIQVNQMIPIGSIDDSDDVVMTLQLIIGLSLQALSLCELSGDLRLEFANDVVIETFGYSICCELWEFRRSDGLRLGVGPGFMPFDRLEDADA